jgi:hypothetical protein
MKITPSRNARWRRYARFSERGLILAILATAVVLGWIVHGATVQRNAVAAIKKAGGLVRYEWRDKDGEEEVGAARTKMARGLRRSRLL